MPFTFRRRFRLGRRLWVNLSKTGVSATGRLGRISGTVGRRPSLSVRLLRGLSWRKRGASPTISGALSIVTASRRLKTWI
jgi:hypothetical protein